MSNTQFTIPNISATGLKELRNRFLLLVALLFVYRIGIYIPIPGVNLEKLLYANMQPQGFLSYLGTLSGGSFSSFTLFTVGLSPYLSVSLAMQMLILAKVPTLEKLKKEGEAGRRKISQYTRYGTFLLGIMVSTARTIYFVKSTQGQGIIIEPNLSFYTTAILTLTTGILLLMWLGEQISERGIGNGISLIIVAGIISSLPINVISFIEQIRQGQLSFLVSLFVIFAAISITAFVVFIERAQRQITVNYPQRQQGRRIYAAQTSYLPLKINSAGIMPTILSYGGITFLMIVFNAIDSYQHVTFLRNIQLTQLFSPGQPLYTLLLSFLIIFFSFFFAAMEANPRKTAEELKKTGAFIPGVRPGEQTAQYIDVITTRLTTIGCFYLLSVVLLPDLMTFVWKVPFSFGGTSLLITVVVIMELIRHIQSLIMSHQYEPLLKKSKIKQNIFL